MSSVGQLTAFLFCIVSLLVGAPAESASAFPLSLPSEGRPIEVIFDFDVHDINAIDSITETFELSGIMTLTWRDARLAFDPVAAGVTEKTFQGRFQVREAVKSWYPQIVLMNDSGVHTRQGVQLRIKPDGTAQLIEKMTAVVEADLDMRTFPLDTQQLEAVFTVLGHSGDEVQLKVDADYATGAIREFRVPGWSVDSITLSPAAGRVPNQASVVLGINVDRDATYVRRLITLPMFVIVLLSFSIFWMDKSSLAERNSVSFIGVLTGVTFQHTAVTVMPPVSYVTVMHSFIFISFFMVAATVPINFAVSIMDRRGQPDVGDRIDQRCRWLFPLLYLGLLATAVTLILLNGGS